ncbi:rhomboid family intramembrane serine protease [Kamptonema cortianum]|nr:rhomboid family intramembrane serine protease [Kamptonema cortianum]
MIPIRDRLPPPRTPLLVYGLIGFNIALFLWEIQLEFAGKLSEVILNWGIIPAQVTQIFSDAVSSGNPAAWFFLVMSIGGIFPALFLHSSYTQILGNLIYLWVFGRRVESVLGWGNLLGLYLGSGFLVGILQILAEPNLTTPLVGSNGAIAAILGAYLLCFPKAKIETILPLVIVFIPIELPALFFLFWWFVQQAFYGVGELNINGAVNAFSIAYLVQGSGLILGALGVYWKKGRVLQLTQNASLQKLILPKRDRSLPERSNLGHKSVD